MYKIPFIFIRGSWILLSNIFLRNFGELNGLFYFIFILGSVVTYGLLSVSLYQMAHRRHLSHAKMAYIPFIRMAVLGDLVAPISLGKQRIYRSGFWAFILEIALFITGALDLYFNGIFFGDIYVGGPIILLFEVLYSFRDIYRICTRRKKVALYGSVYPVPRNYFSDSYIYDKR